MSTRNRNDITDRLRDVAAAAVRQVPDDVVLDGRYLVILGADGGSSFDLLTLSGVELRTQRWTVRRRRRSGWSGQRLGREC